MSKRKTLLIGWDAADWQIINPLLDSGKMPALSSLVNEGVIGNIATLEPVISPILWNSIATGKLGDKHGILGFTETSGIGQNVQPVLSTSRKTNTIWNILEQEAYKTHQIGWWASHPAENLSGISVSNFYGKVNINKDKKAVKAPIGSVYPPEYHDLFHKFRVSPTDITAAHLLPLIPEAAKIDQKKDGRLIEIAKVLSEVVNYHSIATWILENEEWDFLSIYKVAIDTICHRFIKYYPPQLKGVNNKDYEIYKNVVEGIYIFHDMMLERLLKLAGPKVTVVLVSDHGFNSGEQRMLANPHEPAGIAYDHRPYGVICIKGPGIKKDERVYGASLLDVTPTILSACGLPIGKDMDGKPLVQIFEETPKIKYIDSWDKDNLNTNKNSKTDKSKHFTTKEELQQLIDLGYIEDPGEDHKEASQKTSRETKFNLGRIYMHSNRYDKAVIIFEELAEDFPDEPRFKVRLASAYQRTGENDKCEEIVNKLRLQSKENIEKSKKENQINKNKNEKDQKKEKVWKVPLTVLDMLSANNLLAQNKPLKALKLYEKLEKEMPINHKVNIQKGRSYMAMQNYNSASLEYQKCIEKDPDNAAAWVGLSNCQIAIENYEEAAESALNAIGNTYFYPRAHFLLGQALYYLGDYENAKNAYEVCLSQSPNLGKARNQLINIYSNHIKDTSTLKKHKNFINKNSDNTIFIVSGIPRSGTSVMMQMLEADGFSVFTDLKRKADTNNPKGYYEHEMVKRIAVDSSWLKDANGKAVKIVSQLLFHLPENINYKVIFMKRDLHEVIHSQQKMVNVLKNKPTPIIYPAHLEIAYNNNYKRVEEWQKIRENVEILYVDYADLINNPENTLKGLQVFLKQNINIEKMKSVIDKKLYRSKK